MSFTTILAITWLAGALPGLAVGLIWATRAPKREDVTYDPMVLPEDIGRGRQS